MNQFKKSIFSVCPLIVLAVSILAAPLSFSSITPSLSELKPTRAQAITANKVLMGVSQLHLRKHNLNNELSSEVFDRYIEALDSGKAYFLASDIQEFETFRYQLDEALQRSNLHPAFEIFNRYQSRITERLEYNITLIEKGIKSFDFTTEESLERDSKKAHWAKDVAELNDLARRRMKDAIISMRLMEKDDENIQSTLERRYKNQLNRVLQANSEDAFEIYMNAFTQVYDPHTQYFSPKVSENFNINMSLQLEGIGAVLQSDDEYTKVISLVTGGPADKGKELKEADRIIGVGQTKNEIIDVVGWRLDEVVQRIRGKKGTVVFLEVIPTESKNQAESHVISITRDTVNLEDRAAQSDIMKTETESGTKKIGIINIPTFYANLQCMKSIGSDCRSTTQDVERLIIDLKKQKVEGLIIDLRNNGGGSLTEVNQLLGLFIKTGPTVQVKSYNGSIEVLEDRDPELLYDGPLAVMVNRLSASASEIFAGAIQDYQRGIIVGDRTFGKGTVQSLQSLDHGTRGDQLKVTMAKFYRISGASNQHIGIEPDIEYPSLIDHEEIGESSLPNALPSDHIKAANYPKDSELQSALTFLRASHDKRTKNDPDFEYIRNQMKSIEQLRSKTNVSLNMTKRTEEKSSREEQRLLIENQRRVAKGDKPYASIDQLKADNEEDDDADKLAGKTSINIDYELKETGYILTDYISVLAPKARMASH